MIDATVILNPYAGRGRALRARQPLELALRSEQGLRASILLTNGPGHATELARGAVARGTDVVVAAGGDGTIGEVLNGMRRDAEPGIGTPLAVLPLGTANDLATNLGLPRTTEGLIHCLETDSQMVIDLGEVNGWLFANNSAVGLEPVVTLYNIRMTWLRGVIRYLIAALRAIANARQWSMELEWESASYDGPISLVSVGNCPLTGGLFRMAPDADPRDGLLTFVHAHASSRLKMLRLLPRAIDGSYVEDPNVHQFHSPWLRIRSAPGTPLQVDGEIRETNVEALEYRVHPGSLAVFG